MTKFRATYAKENGEIFEALNHGVVCCSAHHFVVPDDSEMIPLPEGSKFFTLPDHEPLGWNADIGAITLVCEGKNDLSAVSAFLPPGYTRLLLPGAYFQTAKGVLPLWAYTALAWKDGVFWVPAVKVDDDRHWNPELFDDRTLNDNIALKADRLKNNRLVQQLKICAEEYHCFAAKNFFMERWECPIPSSPTCNSDCAGCISFQPSGEVVASMERLKFVPTADEIADLALDHFAHASEPLISFGQGCEGDPIMQVDILEKAVEKIKKKEPDGTVNLNTNGSRPSSIKRLCNAGIDSIRISVNSVVSATYTKYYRPKDYTFSDVIASTKIASDSGLFVTINLLVFPGITDQESEVEALIGFVKECGVNLIQMRNLNIDPNFYLETVGFPDKAGIGILNMMDLLRKEAPNIRFGYFNRTKAEF